MGHDAHFLSRLDRARADDVEFALGLYRDHEATRFVLERLKLDDRAERVALALADRGPHVVVTRDGHFVTCLGEGMSTGALPIVTRSRLDALLGKHREQQSRESRYRLEQRKNENTIAFFRRLMERGHALTREEFVAFSAVQPMLAAEFFRRSIQDAVWVHGTAQSFVKVEKVNGANVELARQLHTRAWLAGHEMLLATMGERDDLANTMRCAIDGGMSVSGHMALLASTTHLLRGAWGAAHLGKPLVPAYRKLFKRPVSVPSLMEGALATVAIGLRHESVRKDVRRLFETERKTDGDISETFASIADLALKALDEPDASAALAAGRSVFFAMTSHLPEDDAYRFASEDDVPADLARTALLNVDFDFVDAEQGVIPWIAVPLLATARAEDFYFPRDVARRVLLEWIPDETLWYAQRFAKVGRPEPARSEPRPGRNEPCRCGSGKKYKKCCGA